MWLKRKKLNKIIFFHLKMDVSVNELNNADLIELLLQYDIHDKEIKGSGKNGNVLKKDRIEAFINYSKIEAKKKNVNTLHINNDNMIDILSILNDVDLHNTCLTNKSMYNLCMKNKNLLDRCNYIHNFISNPIEQKKLFNKTFRIYDLIFSHTSIKTMTMKKLSIEI